MRYLVSFLIFFGPVAAYGQESAYKPKHLTRLPEEAVLERARKRQPLVDLQTVTFKDSLGNKIAKDEIAKLDYNKYTTDYYVNQKGVVVETVVRRRTPADDELMQKIIEAVEEGEPLPVVEINCAEAKALLEKILDIDQENRSDERNINYDIDRDNQSKVVSLIEKCGWPTRAEVGTRGMESVFLVIQHASKKLRSKYFPMIRASAAKGDLNLSAVALMEDRMLMENGQKQKYGSQLTRVGDGPLILHPIEDPENVNARRAAMGLGTIEEYLKHFGLEYKPKEN